MILSAHCAALVLQSTLPLPSQRGADSLQLLGRIGEGGLNPERYAGTPLLRIDDDPRGLTLPGGRRSDTGRQSSVKREFGLRVGGGEPPRCRRRVLLSVRSFSVSPLRPDITAAAVLQQSCSDRPPCSRRKNDEAQEGTSFKHPSGSRGCN
eukprot:SAG25_NODE_18_length_24130_cov_1260.109608_8_plen_151_part_00